MKTVLMTGFEPFGGESVNPALEAIRQLDGKTVNGYRLVARSMPVVRGEAIEKIQAMIEEVKPEWVIAVGQAGGRPDITVERVAINVDDFRIPDNGGNQPVDEPVVAGGPVAYWSTLPVKKIVKAIGAEGIPASVSNTAGTFVCNHIFYGLRHYLHEQGDTSRGGFVHIPYLPEQAVRNPGQPSMALEVIIRGLTILVETITADA